MLRSTLRLSQQLGRSQIAPLCCSFPKPFASNPEFTEEAKQFVEAAKQLKGKPGRAAQIEAYAQTKEAARAIAEKMSGEEIDWAREETKARNNLKRKMMEWARDGVEDWEHTEMRELRDNSPVMEQLWTDAIVELESDMGRDWKDLMHHHSLSDPSYRPRS